MVRGSSRSGGMENEYKYFMDLAQRDPITAATEYKDKLTKSKKPAIKTIRVLEHIIAGDEGAWHVYADNLTDAVQFIISNTMLSSAGLGVVNPASESIANTIGNMINEDANGIPFNPLQRKLRYIAKHYGIQVYTINEEDDADWRTETDDQGQEWNIGYRGPGLPDEESGEAAPTNDPDADWMKATDDKGQEWNIGYRGEDLPEGPMDREELTQRAIQLYHSGECGCWADVFDKMESEITQIASEINRSPGYVMASIIDDATDLA